MTATATTPATNLPPEHTVKIHIELTEKDLRRLVLKEIRDNYAFGAKLEETDVSIETKSKQNYKAEWESGAGFRATVSKEITEPS